MRIAYLECFSGISGDMFVGALIDAGVSPDVLNRAVESLGLGARLEVNRVTRNGISATKVDVWVGDRKEEPGIPHEQEHLHDHHHHDHTHDQHAHQHGASHPHSHGRSLAEIQRIISESPLSEPVKRRALSIFTNLGEAEAKIHNKSLEQIHFHEVGAVDAIADIVCAAVASEELAVDEWVSTPVNVGGGTVECAHGCLPVPAPATLELLKGAPIYSSAIDKELATPTGAAILKTLVQRFGPIPAIKVSSTGYGAGGRDLAGQANILRITVGEALSTSAATRETVSVLEANLDDLNPQVFAYVMDRLLAAGALDVFGTPVQMKKGRPGMVLTVLARSEDVQKLAKIIFAETTPPGIRIREERREVLPRRAITVHTTWGEVRMKIANLNGTVTNYAPEYEDCRRIAEQHGIPLKAVMQEAMKVYLDQQNG